MVDILAAVSVTNRPVFIRFFLFKAWSGTQYHPCDTHARNTQPESNYKTTSDNLKLRCILQNNWPVLFIMVKVKKDKNI